MSFFKRLLGKKDEPQRQLDHPSKLNQGDVISLDDSFALPPALRGQQLRVEAVNSYEFENSTQPLWSLKGHTNESIYLSLEEDDETLLVFSIKINRAIVEQLFDLDQFSTIFDEPGKARLTCQPLADNQPHLQLWLAKSYHQVAFAEQGYFHRLDHRSHTISDDTGEVFEAYQLLDDNEQYAIDIEVYERGETDVMLSLYRPLSDIREYWPGE